MFIPSSVNQDQCPPRWYSFRLSIPIFINLCIFSTTGAGSKGVSLLVVVEGYGDEYYFTIHYVMLADIGQENVAFSPRPEISRPGGDRIR